MQSRTRIGAQPSCGDDGGITGRKHEPDMVSRWEWAQPASSIKLCRYGRGVCDSARQQHGDSMSHGEGSDGAHGVRGHQLGVGDFGPMQSRARIRAQPPDVHDAGSKGRKHEPGMVSRWEWAQPASSIQRSSHRRSICDGAWQQHGDSMSHGEGSDGAHGMPSHQLGVGDIDEMHSRTRIEAYRSFGHDSEITGRQHEPGLVSRCEWAQLACSIQQCRDRRGVCDGAR